VLGVHWRTPPDATRATVRTEVKRDNGDRVAVNYYLHKTSQGWKAQDVAIDGISYVNSYRTDFGEQIEAQGIDSVIKRLESGEKPETIRKQIKNKSLLDCALKVPQLPLRHVALATLRHCRTYQDPSLHRLKRRLGG
jgi:hypothetical protein